MQGQYRHFENGSVPLKYLVLSFLVPFLLVPAGAPPKTYQTNFPATEDPISENNNWINGAVTGLDWGNVQTTPGHVFGTNVNPGCSGSDPTACNDSVAALTGTWAANQSVCATVFIGAGLSRTSGTYELELHLHRTIASHNSSGYEFNYSLFNNGNQYMQIVRWNGALGSFNVIGGTSGAPVALNNGDVFCASANAGALKSWIVRGGAVVQSTNPITDTTFTGGAPGVGFFNGSGTLADNANFGFTSFQASELNSSAPAPPTNLRVTGVQ
jgi:hypothetical protein